MSQRQLYRRAAGLGLGFFGVAAIWPVFNTYVPLLLADLGLSAALIGFVLAWDNYLNIFVQPAAGYWSDRRASRWGRRKPWLLAGAPLAALGFVAIPAISGMWGIMAAILLTNVGMALFRTPLVALLGDAFPAEQRSQANGVIHVMGGLGAIAALVGGGLLYKLGAGLPFLFAAALLLSGVGLVLARVPEPAAAAEPVAPGGFSLRQLFGSLPGSLWVLLLAIFCGALALETVQAWISSFGVFVLGLDRGRMGMLLGLGFALPSLLFAVPAGLLGARFGRPRILISGYALLLAVVAAGWFVGSEAALTGLLALGGVASALITVNALPLLFDLDASDARRFGLLTGGYYLAQNLAAVVGPQLTGLLIDLSGQNYRVMFAAAALFLAPAVALTLRLARRAG
ncbi:MAG: SLC45 family MFS transporter [Anaerolineae bacterium]